MLPRGIWALLFVPACTFSTDIPGEGEEPSDEPMPTPAVRCQGTGLTVCVDFEDMPLPTDGMTPGVSIVSLNVLQKDRATEKAAELSLTSQLALGDAAKLDLQRMTIEMWVNPSVVPPSGGDKQSGLFDAHEQYAMNFESDRQFECQIFGSEESDNVDSLTINTLNVWHHVACTYDGAMLKVYVDGRLEGCQPTTRAVSTSSRSGAAIGANIDSNGTMLKNKFVGQLDNVHLYSGALSGASICTLAGGGSSCSDQCPGTSNQGGGYGGWGDWHD